MEAELEGKAYSFILDEPYCWDVWAAPKGADGKLDHNKALTGDDLRDFVDRKPLPCWMPRVRKYWPGSTACYHTQRKITDDRRYPLETTL